jgi:prepilin-type N-terminal cleavage/methylation domain-containing protein
VNLRGLKRRHWILIGLIAGLVVALGRWMAQSDQIMGGPGFIDQRTFESELHRRPAADEPKLIGLAIRPGRDVDLVELTYRVPATDGLSVDRIVKFAAPNPYVPLDGSATYTQHQRISDFIRHAASIAPIPPVRTVWWTTPAALFGLCTLAGLVIVGGLWPIVMKLLSRKASRAIPQVHELRLNETPAATEFQDVSANLSQPAPAAPIAALSQAELDEIPPPSAPPDKHYAGEFYPVEKQVPHGFSLVELLVVLGVIVVLISFLLPAARMARAQAQTSRCAAQLRQLGSALHAYASANGGTLPAWSGWHTWPRGQSDDEPGPAWTIELIPYIGSPDSPIYNCPSWPGPVPCRNYFLAAQWAGRSGRHTMKLSDVTLSSRFVLSGDKTNLLLYPPPWGSGSSQDDADPDDFGSYGALLWPWNGGFYMHHGGNNVLFDDGHVELRARFDPLSMTFNPHLMQDWASVTPN